MLVAYFPEGYTTRRSLAANSAYINLNDPIALATGGRRQVFGLAADGQDAMQVGVGPTNWRKLGITAGYVQVCSSRTKVNSCWSGGGEQRVRTRQFNYSCLHKVA